MNKDAETLVSAAEFDCLLEADNRKLQLQVQALAERNQWLEALAAQKEALARRLERAWKEAQTERGNDEPKQALTM